MPRIHKPVEIKIDEDRVVELLSVKHLLAISDVMAAFHTLREDGFSNLAVFASMSKNIRILRDFVAQFIWSGNGYLSIEEARPLVEEMSIGQLFESAKGITMGVEDLAIPPAQGGTTDSD